MAIINAKRMKVSGEIPSASMADIAFLLLIFFLTTTVFPKDRGLAIVLPEPTEQVTVTQGSVLEITIAADGIVQVRQGEAAEARQVNPAEIQVIWQQASLTDRNLVAAVRTHPEAPYRHMVDVLDALHLAGAERISLEVLGAQPEPEP